MVVHIVGLGYNKCSNKRDVQQEDVLQAEQGTRDELWVCRRRGPGHNGAAPAEGELSEVRVGGKVSQCRNISFGYFST